MVTSASELKESLEKHNATFEALLNLIPAKYYLVQEQSEDQVCHSFRVICLCPLMLLV